MNKIKAIVAGLMATLFLVAASATAEAAGWTLKRPTVAKDYSNGYSLGRKGIGLFPKGRPLGGKNVDRQAVVCWNLAGRAGYRTTGEDDSTMFPTWAFVDGCVDRIDGTPSVAAVYDMRTSSRVRAEGARLGAAVARRGYLAGWERQGCVGRMYAANVPQSWDDHAERAWVQLVSYCEAVVKSSRK